MKYYIIKFLISWLILCVFLLVIIQGMSCWGYFVTKITLELHVYMFSLNVSCNIISSVVSVFTQATLQQMCLRIQFQNVCAEEIIQSSQTGY